VLRFGLEPGAQLRRHRDILGGFGGTPLVVGVPMVVLRQGRRERA
jgi:hypothetical protein